MSSDRQLKAVSSISVGDEGPVSFDCLTAEEKSLYAEKMSANIGKFLGRYLSDNPDESEKLSVALNNN